MDQAPSITSDSKAVIYFSSGPKGIGVFKVSIDGGEPELLTHEEVSQPNVSPDGKSIACFTREGANAAWKIGVFSIDGGEPVKMFPLSAGVQPAPPGIKWLPDSRAISYVQTAGVVSNIYSQSILGGDPIKLTSFDSDRIFTFAWRQETAQLACVRGSLEKDLILISRK